MNNTNGMPEDARLPVAMVERMEHYASTLIALQDESTLADWSGNEQRAFAVYLLSANDTASPTANVIERFESRHVGTFATWAEARWELSTMLGWHPGLRQAEQDDLSQDVSDLLALGEEAIRARLQQLFTITELDDDTVYVFD